MKKAWLFIVAIGIVLTLTGCQTGSKTNTSTDEADSSLIKSGSAQTVNTPPAPPEPTRPTK